MDWAPLSICLQYCDLIWALRLDWLVSANSQPPLDLTPYIIKSNDHYVAGGAFADVYRRRCRDEEV